MIWRPIWKLHLKMEIHSWLPLRWEIFEVVGFYWTNAGSVIVNSERDGSVAVSV